MELSYLPTDSGLTLNLLAKVLFLYFKKVMAKLCVDVFLKKVAAGSNNFKLVFVLIFF